MNNNVENSVEETFDQMLNSVKSINDDFINSYFEDNEVEQIVEGTKEDKEFYDESSLKDLSYDLTNKLFDNEDFVEKPVENINTDNLKPEIEDYIQLKRTSEREEDIKLEKDKLINNEIINLIDEVDSSEEFFDMLEGKMDD